jgi:dUTP pyrophosphatase
MKLLFKKMSEKGKIPYKAHDLDAGYDLYAADPIFIWGKHRAFIPTNIAVQARNIPKGFKFFAKVEGTSGNAKKKGLQPMGGVIDQGYTGDIGVVLKNNSFFPIKISAGDKIAQLIPHLIPIIDSAEEVKEFTDENNDGRGEAGFGSTGTAGSGKKGTKKPKSTSTKNTSATSK